MPLTITPIPTVNIRSTYYYIAETAYPCGQCHQTFQVFAFAVPPKHEQFACDYNEDTWRKANFHATLAFVEYIPPHVREEVASRTHTFREGKDAYGSYWMNHCPHCGAAQDDESLHDSSGSAFCPHLQEDTRLIALHRIDAPFFANGSYHVGRHPALRMVQARSPGTVNNGIRYYENILTRATYGPKKEEGAPEDGFKAALEKAANNNPVGMKESSAAHPDRSSGFDFTFTAPRSVSLRLDEFSMYDHRKADIVVDAFEKAVTTTMSRLEGRIEAKVIENGRIVCRPSGNLLYCAHIPHFHAQPMLGRSDITLHGHAFLVNVTSYRDKWYTVDFLTLASELDRYRALFLEQLAANLEAAGHPTVRVGQGFELQEVDQKRLEKPGRRPVAYLKAAT